jgi:hypothetical protein
MTSWPMSEVNTQLRAIRALVERGWCGGDRIVVDESGEECDVDSISAAKWSVWAAAWTVLGGSPYGTLAWRMIMWATPAEYSEFVPHSVSAPNAFNDAPGRTQAEVLDLIDRATAIAEAA